ncbi:NAD-dependent epimerase/dehydratase family protein [Streptomyces sp. AK02-01A]|uniref:NAD-dependent epimerase/dehydratase family protein n=1 Tax=Streptomyces sp. AK02-01A TaxID=3028648 RepID=UPI0029A96F48|nr:NAD-dependent epimerase/dehydratase family protein [Streptomyces sp. AK02-01A]MDX3852355.1 NAD-dependent epimerase/dehydratase family protein [Streptomyces sp. AK02-01A]
MRCLVTGGAGFIGSHLVEHLLALGDDVVVLDDLSTGSERNLAAVASNPRLRLIKGDICVAETVARAMEGVDEVYHLAAAVGVFTILDRTLESLRTNLTGTETVLDAARHRDVPFLLASTSEVYGKNTADGLTEEDDRILGSPLKSRWSYSEAKALDETLAALYAARYGLRMVIARLFNTVGPRQSGQYGMVVPRFVDQSLAGEPLTVFGDGTQIRCFCHVADVVPALVALLRNEDAHGTVYNIGGSRPVTIAELAERTIAATGSASTMAKIPYTEAYGAGFEDMRRRIPNCDKAYHAIGFRAGRTLDDIIADVVAERRPL